MKELLSGEVLAAVVTVMGGIIVTWMTIRGAKKERPETSAPMTIPAPHPVPVAIELPAPAVRAKAKKGRPPISKVSIQEILAVLKSTPPFHHDQIKQNYMGLRVRWEAELSAVTPRSNGAVSVSAETTTYDYLSCEAERKDVLELINAPEKSVIIIEGTLTSIGSGYGKLVDCVIVRKPAGN